MVLLGSFSDNAVNHDSHFLSEPIDNNLDDSATQYMSNSLKIRQNIINIAQNSQEENATHQIKRDKMKETINKHIFQLTHMS